MKKIVIVVEDELAIVELLRKKLEKSGYGIIVANNGAEGLTKIRNENPDLVLLDIRMTVMDGITMLELLRKTEYGKDIKVLIFTNYEPDEMLKKKMKENNAPFVIKSNTKLETVLKKVDELLK